jgi:hypothetical protein
LIARAAKAALIDQIDRAMEQGAAFLITGQADDGSWRSETYGNMRSGRPLTPLVLSALLFSPSKTAGIADAYRRGVDFVATPSSGPLMYPVYSLAMGAMVLTVPANRRHLSVRDRLIEELRRRQLVEINGWVPQDASFGGWGYWPTVPRRQPAAPAKVPHELLSSNLSTTLFALAGLVMAGVPADDPLFAQAEGFVRRCQNGPPAGDGGFIFTPANDIQNKAGPRLAAALGGAEGFESYGTMTADGIRALFLLGVASDDPGLVAATAWLADRWDPAVPAGRFPQGSEWSRDGAYYYWAWSSAHALYGLGGRIAWAEPLVDEVTRRQDGDGAWRNPFTSMRENDPFVATPMALAALGLSRMALTGHRRTAIPMK